MRWEALFADLEGELAAGAAAELALEVADRTRREVAQLRLVDRLRPAVGYPVSVTLPGASVVAGRLADVGADWVLVAEHTGREALVPLGAVFGIAGLGRFSDPPDSEGVVASRRGLRHALRSLARSRAPTLVVLLDHSVLAGTIDRVGADYLELAVHPAGELRHRAAVREVRTIPVGAIAVVRSG